MSGRTFLKFLISKILLQFCQYRLRNLLSLSIVCFLDLLKQPIQVNYHDYWLNDAKSTPKCRPDAHFIVTIANFSRKENCSDDYTAEEHHKYVWILQLRQVNKRVFRCLGHLHATAGGDRHEQAKDHEESIAARDHEITDLWLAVHVSGCQNHVGIDTDG